MTETAGGFPADFFDSGLSPRVRADIGPSNRFPEHLQVQYSYDD
jgi:hypothetical protein